MNTTTQLYDLDFRNYDPLLGCMNGVDPMAAKYSSLTPYNYSFNDPVSFTDPSGADPYYTINYSATTSHYYTMYTYDDRIDPTGLQQPICGQCWREGNAGAMAFYGAATGGGSFSSWQTGTFAGVPLTRYGQMLADARDVRSGKMSVAEYAAAHGSAPTQEDVGRLFQAMGYNAKTDMINGDAYVTYVTPAIVSSKYGTIEMQDHFVTSFSASGANVGKNRFVVNTPYHQTQGGSLSKLQAGLGPGMTADEFRGLLDGILITTEGFLLKQERTAEQFLKSPASKGHRHLYKTGLSTMKSLGRASGVLAVGVSWWEASEKGTTGAYSLAALDTFVASAAIVFPFLAPAALVYGGVRLGLDLAGVDVAGAIDKAIK